MIKVKGLRGLSITREEAEFLLMGITGLKRHELYLNPTKITQSDLRRFHHLAKMAKAGVPVQYLTHSAPFLDLDLYVDERVFIPRPETEELVLRTIDMVSSPRVIIDYGTGSGAIAIAVARKFPKARVWAIDASTPALMVAEKNIRRYRLSNRIRLINAQNFDHPKLKPLANRVDLLISNPPYIPETRLKLLPKNVRDYEPRLALDGGKNGVEIITMILRSGLRLLAPYGLLALEIDSAQGEFIKKLIPDAKIESDLNGRVRYAFVKKGGL